MEELVAEITFQARSSPDVNQASGVSVRMSIANYETLAANALRRALRVGEREAVPRISDLDALQASTLGQARARVRGRRAQRGRRGARPAAARDARSCSTRAASALELAPVVRGLRAGLEGRGVVGDAVARVLAGPRPDPAACARPPRALAGGAVAGRGSRRRSSSCSRASTSRTGSTSRVARARRRYARAMKSASTAAGTARQQEFSLDAGGRSTRSPS